MCHFRPWDLDKLIMCTMNTCQRAVLLSAVTILSQFDEAIPADCILRGQRFVVQTAQLLRGECKELLEIGDRARAERIGSRRGRAPRCHDERGSIARIPGGIMLHSEVMLNAQNKKNKKS